jgi:hypothetical protein
MMRDQKWGNILRRAGIVMVMGASAMLLSASQGWATTIDHFNVTQGNVNHLLTVAQYSESPLFLPQSASFTDAAVSVDLLGGNRKVNLDWLSGNHGGSAGVSLYPANHYLNYSDTAGVTSKLVLTYDGNDVTNGFADTDFTDGGTSNSILVQFIDADFGSTVKVTVYDGVNVASLSMLSPAGPSVESFLYTNFSGGFTLANWQSINKVVVEIDGVAAGDYKIDMIGSGTIPEPLTMLGTFLGLGSLGAYIRRRRMA